MGAAAALIPGIAGIAGGQYMKNREENQQADMMRNRIASANRFLGQEQLPQVNSMGVRPPVQTQLEPGIGGDATRRALEARSMSGKARQFAIEQASFGNSKPLEALVTSQMTPKKPEQYDLAPGAKRFDEYNNVIAFNPVEAKPESFESQRANAYLQMYGGDPIKASQAMKRDDALAGRAGEQSATPSFEYTNDGTTQKSYNMKNPADVAAYEAALRVPGTFKGTIAAPSVTEKEKTEGKQELERAVDDFTNQFLATGTETGIPIIGDPRAAGKLSASRGAILAAVKKAETLGTLDRGLIEFFKMVLDDPTGLTSGLIPNERIKGQLEAMYSKLGKEPPAGIKSVPKKAMTPVVGGSVPSSSLSNMSDEQLLKALTGNK